jgi:hypothetical protein
MASHRSGAVARGARDSSSGTRAPGCAGRTRDLCTDTTSPPPGPAAPLLPKACADGNAAALDKGLEALAALLPKASDALAARMVSGSSTNIVAKCLGARPGTAAKGTECLKQFVEAECGEKVVVSRAPTERADAACSGAGLQMRC